MAYNFIRMFMYIPVATGVGSKTLYKLLADE
jgi:hypothetical protein